MKVLIFDTETTGLPQTKNINQDSLDKWPHIVQFSYIIFDNDTNSFDLSRDFIIRMDPGILIPKEASNIHGISDQMSQEKGVHIEEVLNQFFYHLRQVDLLVGHNVSFDINMIYVELLRVIYFKTYALEHISAYKSDLHFLTNFKNIYCTMQESIELCNIKVTNKYGKEYSKFPKLSELHEKLFQVVPQNLHNSFVDILATLRCFMMLKFKKDIIEDCKDYIQVMQSLT